MFTIASIAIMSIAPIAANGGFMVTHELKVYPQFWLQLVDKSKPFDCRLDDRSYKVNDWCILRQFDPSFGYVDKAVLRYQITFIMRHEDFPNGVPIGYVILGFGGPRDGN